MANPFAYLMLFGWPLVVWFCFGSLRSARAVFVGLMGALMLLPQLEVDLPVIPPLDKETLPGLAVMIAALASRRAALRAARPLSGLNALVLLMVIGAFGTVFTNREFAWDGVGYRQAMTPYDVISMLVRDLLGYFFPFLIGRAFYRTTADLEDLTRAMIVAGLIYMPLCLFEIRFSPQLHNWIYGYFPHSFAQTRRGGGFRPVVFMGHGLTVARFFVVVVLMCVIASRAKLPRILSIPRGAMLFGMLVMLLLCKTLGAFVLAAVALPVLLWSQPKTQMRVAVLLALVVLVFPALRAAGFVPTESLVELAAKASPERAQSLEFRFDNEDELLAHAMKKPLFGWGGFGRNSILEPREGQKVNELITDGEWINVLGIKGWVGYLAIFGLYVGPILVANRNLSRLRSYRDRILLASFAVIMAVLAVDLIPNSTLSFPQAFLCGALYGLAKGMGYNVGRPGVQQAQLARAQSAA